MVDSSDLFLYQDGVLIQANTTNSSTWTLNSSGPLEIGGGTNLNANEDLNGYMDVKKNLDLTWKDMEK